MRRKQRDHSPNCPGKPTGPRFPHVSLWRRGLQAHHELHEKGRENSRQVATKQRDPQRRPRRRGGAPQRVSDETGPAGPREFLPRPAPQHGESMFPRVLTRSGVRGEAPSPQHDCVPQMPVRAGPAEILLGQRRLYSSSTQRARRKERAHGPGDPALTRRGRRKPPAASTPWTQPRQRPGQSPRTHASARASCPHCRSRSGTSSAR